MTSDLAQRYFYEIYDVFTTKALEGNSLAIVHDAHQLDAASMQSIAREFNLAETVFVLSPENPVHAARLRIFTPYQELCFAGHPTIGTAIALAQSRRERDESLSSLILILEEDIGLVRTVIRWDQGSVFAEFDLPRPPEKLDLIIEKEVAAAALGLSTHEIGFENHVPTVWSAGSPYILVPVKNLICAAKISIDPVFIEQNIPKVNGRLLPFYIYTRETRYFECDYHARMFSLGNHVYEDAATGSAVAAFAGAVNEFDRPCEALKRLWIEQGIEMERPSRIQLELEITGKQLTGARIGGNAVKVAEGVLLL